MWIHLLVLVFLKSHFQFFKLVKASAYLELNPLSVLLHLLPLQQRPCHNVQLHLDSLLSVEEDYGCVMFSFTLKLVTKKNTTVQKDD